MTDQPRASDGPDGQPRPKFSPEEQAVVVFLSHTVILIFVTVIILSFSSGHELPPGLFLVGEGTIVVLFLSTVVGYEKFAGVFIRFMPNQEKRINDGLARWETKGPSVAFACAYLLQYLALTPLLTTTGGPIDSPFAQLAVAFAVFTPLLANQPRTVGIALVTSLAYYSAMIAIHGFDAGSDRPSPWMYFAVTSLIVSLTVGLTMLDRLDGERRNSRAELSPQ